MSRRKFYLSGVALVALICLLVHQRGVGAFGTSAHRKRQASTGGGAPSCHGESDKEQRNPLKNTHDVDGFTCSGFDIAGERDFEGSSYRVVTTRASFALKCAQADDMTWDPSSAPKLDFNEDFYTVLEVDVTVTAKELKKAYYKMVFKYHPDNRKDASEDEKKLCNQQMMVINNAYRILKEDNLRQTYDVQRKRGLYGNKAKMPRGNGRSDTPSGRPTTDRTQRRTSYSTTSDDDIDDMGWSKKNQKQYRAWSGWDVHEEAQRWAEEEEDGIFDDLDEFVNEGWFDEDMKKKLIARRKKQAQEQNPTAAARARYGDGDRKGGPTSIFEEIKDLLKEEERSQSFRRDTQRRNAEWEQQQKYTTRNTNSNLSDSPSSPINKVRRELQRLEMKVSSDHRDWGEILDKELIEERLRDLHEIKQLKLRLEELLLLQEKNGEGRYNRGDGSYGGGGYDDENSGNGNPQPRRQRSNPSGGSPGYAAGFDDDRGCDTMEEEIEDRLYQRYRRRRAAEGGGGRDGDASVENEMRRLRRL